MSIWGITSVIPLALPALAQATESSAPPTETKVDLAKKHFKAARKLYENGEYEAALAEFQKSYDLVHIIDLQYNIGLCYEKLGKYDEAIAAIQLYVDGNPGKEEKEEAETRIAWIRSQMKKKEEPAGQMVTVVVPPEDQAPPPEPTRPVATRVTTRRKRKREVRVPADVTWRMPPQEEAPVSPQPAAAIPPPPAAPAPLARDTYVSPSVGANETIGVTASPSRPRPFPYRTLMWTSLGLSGAGLVAGLLGHAATKEKEMEYSNTVGDLEGSREIVDGKFSTPQAEATHRPRLDEIEEDFNQRRIIAYTGFIGSAVFLGLGGVFYWLDRDRVRATVEPSSQGAKVNLEVSF